MESISYDPHLVKADKSGQLDLRPEFATGGKHAGQIVWGDVVIQGFKLTKDASTGRITTEVVTSHGTVNRTTDRFGEDLGTTYTSPTGTVIDL